MSKLDQIKNIMSSQSASQNHGKRDQYEINMLVKISHFEIGGQLETNFAVGERVDTKEIVKVNLMQIEQDPKSKYKRIEMNEFANPHNRARHVKENCYMVFEKTRQNPDGTYTARWGVVLDREPDGTKVAILTTRLVHGFTQQNIEWYNISVLNPIEPIEITNAEKLDSLLIKYLQPRTPGSYPVAIIKITDLESNEKISFELKPKLELHEVEGRQIKRAANSTVTLQEIKENDADKYSEIINLINTDGIRVDFISGSKLNFGSATKEKMEKQHQSSKDILFNSFIINKDNTNKESEQEGNENPDDSKKDSLRKEYGYISCIIATRCYFDGSPYCTYLKPFRNFDTPIILTELTDFNQKK